MLKRFIILFIVCLPYFRVSAVEETERARNLTRMLCKDLIGARTPKKSIDWLWKQHIAPQNLNKKPRRYNPYHIMKKIDAITRKIKKPSTIAQKPEHLWKNAHQSLLPYDETRILPDLAGFFLSGNRVYTPHQEYLVTEAPMMHTLHDFWLAILGTNVRTIVALAMPTKNKKRYPAYWQEHHFPRYVDGWIIKRRDTDTTLHTSRTHPSHKIIKRTFVATKERDTRIITHLHYENWPDHGAPAPDLFQDLLKYLDSSHPDAEIPILAHCLAGLGRAGTFVTTHSLRKDIRKGTPLINIAKRIIELRAQRRRMVGTPRQYEAIYTALKKTAEQTPIT